MAIYAPKTRSARLRRTVALLVVAGVGAFMAPQAFATDESAPPVQLDTYTVSSGDTLWQIAANLTPQGRDVRDTMAQIQSLNALEGSQLQAGEQLLLPQVD